MSISLLATLFVVCAIFGLIAKLIRQPLMVGYVFAGIFLSVLGLTSEVGLGSDLGKIGVTLLLFTVGLELSFSDIRAIGKVAAFLGVGQIVITTLLGFIITRLLGFDLLSSVYIALALTFSSTIIIVKLLAEKNDLNSLYGKIAIGFLLIQDFVALGILIFLTALSRGESTPQTYFWLIAEMVALFVLTWELSKNVLSRIFGRFISDSPELIYVLSIAWVLAYASIAAGPLGLSLEIGGFMAGLAFASLPEHIQIAARVKPVREFFLPLFFLSLGSQVVISSLPTIILPALALSVLVLVGKPLIILVLLGILGYGKRTGFFVGLATSQVSEFSFILMGLGLSLNHVANGDFAVVILVGAITMTISTYAFMATEKIYPFVKNYLTIFERKKTREGALSSIKDYKDHIIVVGSGRVGGLVVKYLVKHKIPVVVVDFDPTIVASQARRSVDVIFGDIADPEILTAARPETARAIINTIPNWAENNELLTEVRVVRKLELPLLLSATTTFEATRLMKRKATYVLIPHMVAGVYLVELMKKFLKRPQSLSNASKFEVQKLSKVLI